MYDEEGFSAVVFFITNGLMNSQQITDLHEKRLEIDEKVADKSLSLRELALAVKEELELFMECKQNIHVNEDNKITTQKMFTYMFQRIISLFQFMHVQFKIDCKILSDLLDFLYYDDIYLKDTNFDFFAEAISKIDSHQKLWIQLMNVCAKMGFFDKMLDICLNQAVKSLTTNFLGVWNLTINHLISSNSKSLITKAYDQGLLLSYENITHHIRYQYLEWYSGDTQDIILIRELFEKLKNTPSLRLYEAMIAAEIKNKSELIQIRQLYSEACRLFAKDNMEFLETYMDFEFSKEDPTEARKLILELLEYLKLDLTEAMLDKINTISSKYNNVVLETDNQKDEIED